MAARGSAMHEHTHGRQKLLLLIRTGIKIAIHFKKHNHQKREPAIRHIVSAVLLVIEVFMKHFGMGEIKKP
jgi:hypothetical protein